MKTGQPGGGGEAKSARKARGPAGRWPRPKYNKHTKGPGGRKRTEWARAHEKNEEATGPEQDPDDHVNPCFLPLLFSSILWTGPPRACRSPRRALVWTHKKMKI